MKKDIRVAVMSANIEGGAAIAARRIHEALRARSINSTFIYKNGQLSLENSLRITSDDVNFDILDKFVYEFDEENRKDGGAILSLPYPPVATYFLDKIIDKFDVFNVHWISGLISPESMAYISSHGKKLVWTIHDENAYTAVCHYRNGCNGYLNGCKKCPQVADKYHDLVAAMYRAKIENYPQNITIAAPSRWIADMARNSPMLTGRNIVVTPNGLDTDLFTPALRNTARKELGLSESDKIILCGCISFFEKRKGWEYLREILSVLSKRIVNPQEVKLLSFGEAPEAGLPFEHINCGFVDNDYDIAKYYAASDVVALPSTEDNLPNIMLESLSCGVPVVGFKIGGVSDAVIDGKTGYSVDAGDILAFSERLIDCLYGNSLANDCRKFAVDNYAQDRVSERYCRLFEDAKSAVSVSAHLSGITDNVSTMYSTMYSTISTKITEHYFQQMIQNTFCYPLLEKIVLATGKKVVVAGIHDTNIYPNASLYDLEPKYTAFFNLFQYVDYIIDNNPKVQGFEFHNVNIYSPDKLKEEAPGSVIIVVFIRNYDGFVNQLKSLGINESQIILVYPRGEAI